LENEADQKYARRAAIQVFRGPDSPLSRPRNKPRNHFGLRGTPR
jgi:hypothetical protein